MPAISFEFFPPKTDEQRDQLDKTVRKLKQHAPDYVSVTFGAGGSTLSYTNETVKSIRSEHGLSVAPHLSCMGGTRAEISALLDEYKESGCRRIVALRGDLPSGMASPGHFRYAAELVSFIRENYGNHFHIEVAAYPEIHPQAENALVDLQHFKAKCDAGADGAITQYFFNPDAYFRFVDDVTKLGVTIPVVPGIMPIANFSQLRRFSEQCGAEIPRWIVKRMQAHGDDARAIRELGADVVAGLCQRLLDGGAPGIHFYTINRYRTTEAVLERLS
ncbi:methylenetetrahydrofolate reductase [NAD(P)H] [Luteibacter anthropi]|uniref:Methylenetetrahydrofolate reductase n=1 Tax=Luteibacter anthropi TaxID=564369 RepID=A0A7X5UD63_9GAMM|nr:methylenetetrahydrofolate reductase [NAD(P)H] [Luteibacter anthropi]NII08320.1 methylenetetrahydrofolate reductase [NAD(P)H] [Luteibacter anthropi]URX64392.1 methylenetetrahydrofolate reductase [NAD(P)H] [Luteibacter anthropi]